MYKNKAYHKNKLGIFTVSGTLQDLCAYVVRWAEKIQLVNFKLILTPQLWGTTQRLYLNFQPKRPARDRAQWPQSFENRPLRPKFQSCSNQLKLNIQSLLILLITKIPGLSILSQNCGSLCSNRASILHHKKFDAPLLNKLPYLQLKFDKIGTFQVGQEALDIQFQLI